MARLLDPATFGLVAMALVTLKTFSYLSQIGLSMTMGTMQRVTIDSQDLRVTLGIVWVSSLVAITAVVFLAPLASAFFHRPELTALVQALAVSLLLQALANVSVSLLRRQLRFKAMAIVETIGYALGFGVVGIACAVSGWGPWSLVAATIGQWLVTFALAYALTRHALLPRWKRAEASHWRYGARHTAISFSEFLSANVSTLLIGRLLGDAALGLYNRAQVLAYQPVEKAAGIITKVLFPVVAALQHDIAKVGQLYILGFGFIGVWASAVSLSLYAAAPEVVALLLGPQWGDAVPVVRLLTLAVPAIFMSNISGVVCDAMNLLEFKLKLQMAGMALVLALVILLSPFGITGIVAGLVIGEWIRALVYFYYLADRLDYQHLDCLRSVAAVTGTGLIAWSAVHFSLGAVQDKHLGLGWLLLIAISMGAIGLGTGLLLLWRLLDSTQIGRLGRTQVPGWQQLCRITGRTEGA